MKKYFIKKLYGVYVFFNSIYIFFNKNFIWLVEHPKLNFYKYLIQMCIIFTTLVFGVLYKNTSIPWVDVHLFLLFGRAVFIIIAFLLHSKYKNFILTFFYSWYQIDIRKKSDFVDKLMLGMWTGNFVFYRFFASLVHLILLLVSIYYK